MIDQNTTQAAGEVCDGCSAVPTATAPLVPVMERMEGIPTRLWLCPVCYGEKQGEGGHEH